MFKETAKSSGIPFAEVVVLGLLAEKPRYGYEIDSEIKLRGLHLWGQVAFSSIYYMLGKLEKRSFVTFHHHKEGKYPTRKVYSITESGRAYLRRGVLELIEQNTMGQGPPVLGIAFIHVLEKSEALVALKRLKENLLSHSVGAQDVMKQALVRYPVPSATALIDLAEKMHGTMLNWLSDLIDTLEDYPWENWQVAIRTPEPDEDCLACDENEKDEDA